MAEYGITYTLDTPRGTLTFNPSGGGEGLYLTAVAGLDGAAVRAPTQNIPAADGAILFDFFRGGRFPIFEGYIRADTLSARTTLEDQLRTYTDSILRQDGQITFTPSGQEAAFTDEFSDGTIPSTVWTEAEDPNVEISETGGVLRVTFKTTGTGTSSLSQVASQSLTGRSATWQVAAVGSRPAGQTVALRVKFDADDAIEWRITNQGFEVWRQAAGSWSQAGETGTDDATHAYMRVREASGYVQAEHSQDGEQWTVTWSGAAWAGMGAAQLVLEAVSTSTPAAQNSVDIARVEIAGAARSLSPVRLLDQVQITGTGPVKAFQLALASPQPLIGSAHETRVVSAPLTAGPGSLQFPFILPFTFGDASAGGGLSCVNAGLVPAYPVIRIHGYCVSPQIRHLTAGMVISLPYLTVGDGDYAEIDTWQETAVLNGSDEISLLGALDIAESDFFPLDPGLNQLQLTAAAFQSGAYATVIWQDGYL